jgi:hypothetical protein
MATAEVLDKDDELIEISDSSALEALNRSEIDIQISTAKRYPRSIKNFKQQAMEMATLDEDTAGSMYYTVPRAGKKITGPSIRMAEVVGSCFGNLRYGARVVEVGDKFLAAQGACHDLEKNIAINYEVRRRITNSKGERFSEDMIQTTGNAACSIALREAIFRVVPRSLFMAIYEAARATSLGKAQSMSERRQNALEWYRRHGATEKEVFAFLGRNGIDEMDTEDCLTLRGLMNAIKDGEITIEEALKPPGDSSPQTGSKAKPSKANDLLKPKAAQSNADWIQEKMDDADHIGHGEPPKLGPNDNLAMTDDEQTLASFEQLLETTDSVIKADTFRDKAKKEHEHLAAQIDQLTEQRIAAIKGKGK